jgi:hypothetical protein
VSIALFRKRLARSRLHPDDIQWMPRRLEEFARSHPEADGLIRFSDPEAGQDEVRALLANFSGGFQVMAGRCTGPE